MLKRLYRTVYRLLMIRWNHIRYAKKIGVNMLGGGVHLYGAIGWGTEPWLITLGSNVHITDGVKFVTHDGGTLV